MMVMMMDEYVRLSLLYIYRAIQVRKTMIFYFYLLLIINNYCDFVIWMNSVLSIDIWYQTLDKKLYLSVMQKKLIVTKIEIK
jgi:hypothetical protein